MTAKAYLKGGRAFSMEPGKGNLVTVNVDPHLSFLIMRDTRPFQATFAVTLDRVPAVEAVCRKFFGPLFMQIPAHAVADEPATAHSVAYGVVYHAPCPAVST